MDPFTLFAIVSAITSVVSGIAGNEAAQEEAGAQKKEAKLRLTEGKEDARRKGIEGQQFRSQQALAFLASGVSLEGSPLATLEETQIKTHMEVDSLLERANAQYRLDMDRASSMQKQGTASIIGGVGGAALSLAKLKF